MSTRILDRDPLSGIVTTFRFDHARDEIVVGAFQDCEPVLEDNKRAMIEVDHAAQMKNDWIHYAKIPNIVILKWKQDHGVDFFNPEHKRGWLRLLNSPDYAYLKRSPISHSE